MKKILLALIFGMSILLCGCSLTNDKNKENINRDYSAGDSENNSNAPAYNQNTEPVEPDENPGTTEAQVVEKETSGLAPDDKETTSASTQDERETTSQEKESTPVINDEDTPVIVFSGEAVVSNSDYGLKVHDGVLDFDTADGPYCIVDMRTGKMIDSTCKDAKVLGYELNGDILKITVYSSDKPENTTYFLDLTKSSDNVAR